MAFTWGARLPGEHLHGRVPRPFSHIAAWIRRWRT